MRREDIPSTVSHAKRKMHIDITVSYPEGRWRTKEREESTFINEVVVPC